MKTLKELREDRANLLNEAEALFGAAQQEKRDMTPEEMASYDRIVGKGKPGEDGHTAGDVAKLDDEIVRAEKREAIKATLVSRQAVNNPPTHVEHVSAPMQRLLGVQRNSSLKGYDNREEALRAGLWFAANILGHDGCATHCQNFGIQNAISTGSGGGNFLVPEEMERAIIRLVETYGVFRKNTRTVPMTSDTLYIPRRTAGVTAYYVNEVPSSITESSPTAGQAQLVAKVLAVRTLLSRDFAEDAIIDVVNWITDEIALAMATAEDSAGFNGDGTSTYGGIVGLKNALLAGSVYTAITGNTAFSTLDRDDFEGMVGMLPTYALPGAKWFISQAGYWASMARLLDAAGGNTMVNLAGGPPTLQFIGFPVVISQVLNTTLTAQTSTTGLAYFGNLMQSSTLGNRRGMETQILRELYAATRQIGIITTERFDINNHETGTASVPGPMIVLKTPGS